MRPLARLLPIAIFALAALAAVAAAATAARLIERRAGAAVAAALAAGGEDWAVVAADGLRLVLSGVATSDERRFRALTIAGGVVDSARVIDTMTVADPPPPAPPRHALEILAGESGIALIGLVPDADAGGGLAARLATALPTARVADMTEPSGHPPGPGWDAAVAFGLTLVADLPRAKISISADRVAVSAVGASAAEKRRLETEFAARAPRGLDLALDISAPRPVFAPFTLRFVIDAEGPRFDACAADDAAAQAAIVAAAVAAGAIARTGCPIGLGVPSPAWGGAAATAIAALAELGAGSVTFRDADVTLIAAHDVPATTFDRVAGELKARLPAPFALRAERLAPPSGEAEEAVPEFTAVLAADGRVELRGLLSDERMRSAVDAFARVRFGADAVLTATRLEPALPDGWPQRVLAGLDALAELAEGSLEMHPDLVALTGVTGRPEASDAIARMFSERLGPGAEFSLSLRYDRRLDPDAGLLGPADCLAGIAAIQAAGKLTFAPGSARLTAEAAATLDAIADVLRGCAEFPLEIAGHTDAQGRAEMNLRLSQERAEAVLAGLLDRRVSVAAMVARGYGAAAPVADNATEAGREANRRIEFRLPAAAAEAAGATAAAADDGPAPAAAPGPAPEPAAGPAQAAVAAAVPAGDAAAADAGAGTGAAAAAAGTGAAAAADGTGAAPPAGGPAAAALGGAAATGLAVADAASGAAAVRVDTPDAATPRPRPRPARD